MVNSFDINLVTFRSYERPNDGHLAVKVKDNIFVLDKGRFIEAPAGQYTLSGIQSFKAKIEEDGSWVDYMGNRPVNITTEYYKLSRAYLQGYATTLETGQDTCEDYVYLKVQKPGGIIYNVIQIGKRFILGFNEAADEREGKFYTKGFLLNSLEEVEDIIESMGNRTQDKIEADMVDFEIS